MQPAQVRLSTKLFQINANWTAVETLQGWKHYRIAGRRQDDAGELELEMMAVCDRELRFWVKGSDLRDEAVWVPGWR